MGEYKPKNTDPRIAVIETLSAAEEDHILDCPNAEWRLRAAALFLDILLSALAISGIQHICGALQTHLGHIFVAEKSTSVVPLHQFTQFIGQNASFIAGYLFISLKVFFAYFYFVWSLTFAGGSPGKLLLGLKVIGDKTGRPPTLPVSLIREITKLFGISFLFGVLPMFWGKTNRPLHDLVCDTTVKRIHGRL